MLDSTTPRAALSAVLAATSEQARVAGFILAWARGDQPAEVLVHGQDADDQPLAEASYFPIASLTKLAAALAVLRLVEAGAFGLDDPLGRHLPEAAAAEARPTLRDLLCHVGGLPLDLPNAAGLYKEGLDWPTIARASLATPPERPPRTRVQYSNVGYSLLAVAVERLTGEPFAAALERLVAAPLGLELYLGAPPPRPTARLADVRGPHRDTPLEPFNSRFWQGLGLPYGGSVGTTRTALGLVRAFRGQPAGFLRPETLAEATANQTDDLGGGQIEPLIWEPCPWGLGPELRGRKAPHWAPASASPESFGHAGATGSFAWADPRADLAWALLGSRSAQNGWLLRAGAAIGAAVLENAG